MQPVWILGAIWEQQARDIAVLSAAPAVGGRKRHYSSLLSRPADL